MKKVIIPVVLIFAVAFLLREKNSGPIVSQNGIAVNQLADEIFTKYDQDNNDTLDVATESFLRIQLDDVIKSESRGLLFVHADKYGDGNQSLTKTELYQYLITFDTNKDGEITTYANIFKSIFGGQSEWNGFVSKYDEKFSYKNQ